MAGPASLASTLAMHYAVSCRGKSRIEAGQVMGTV
jgi:hypothetical protein